MHMTNGVSGIHHVTELGCHWGASLKARTLSLRGQTALEGNHAL